MGLDMYACKTKAKPKSKVDFEWGDNDGELFYWRKHPNLHGWLEKLYRKHNGKDEMFNCSCIELSDIDLDALEAAIGEDSLPGTSGFFFGSSGCDEEERKRDLDFVSKARKAIADGWHVYYTSSW